AYKGTIIASAGNMNPKLIELSGPALEGVYCVSLFAPDSQNSSLKQWMTQYKKDFKNEPSFIGSLGAQAVQVLAEAADKAGTSRDYEKISQTLKGRKWDTLLGQISFTDKGQAVQNIYLVQVKNKQIVSVSSGS